MIRDLDNTLRTLLTKKALPGGVLASAKISFDLPDTDWRSHLQELTVNCYLYDIRENRQLRSQEPVLQRSADGARAQRRQPPVHVDCAYCITAWSVAQEEPVLEEHTLLSEVLEILLKNPTLPRDVLQGDLAKHPPYPTVIAAPDGAKSQPEFWSALNQRYKPSLNYIVTLALQLDAELEMQSAVSYPQIVIVSEHKAICDAKQKQH